MSSSLVAKRYAKAFGLVSKGHESQYLNMLKSTATIFEVKQAKNILCNMSVAKRLKKELFEEIFAKGNMPNEIKAFIYTIVDAGRIDKLPQIVAAYEEFINSQSGIEKGQIITPLALTKDQVAAAEEAISKVLQSKVKLENKVEPSVLGGFKVNMGHKLIDLSLQSKLAKLKNTLEK